MQETSKALEGVMYETTVANNHEVTIAAVEAEEEVEDKVVLAVVEAVEEEVDEDEEEIAETEGN